MEPGDYADFPSYEADPQARKWNLWGYIDARDGAQAVRRALEHGEPGLEVFVIAGADTVMTTPSRELVEQVFPGVEVRGDVEGTRRCCRSTRPGASSVTSRSTPGATSCRASWRENAASTTELKKETAWTT